MTQCASTQNEHFFFSLYLTLNSGSVIKEDKHTPAIDTQGQEKLNGGICSQTQQQFCMEP